MEMDIFRKVAPKRAVRRMFEDAENMSYHANVFPFLEMDISLTSPSLISQFFSQYQDPESVSR